MTLQFFERSDFDCQETGENKMDATFLRKLDALRFVCNFPFIVTSGYRSPRHSVEVVKDRPGQHAQGLAADIRVSGAAERYSIVKQALKMGFTGVGVADTFVHVDTRTTPPVLWSY